MQKVGWPSPERELVAYVEDERDKTLAVYKIKQTLLQEHSNTEEDTLAGGYRYRQVWAFFPTDTLSRVPGIINAPWKIDFGRSALSPGDYNKTVMQAAADLIAEHISRLSEADDPGRILGAFPRQLEPKDEPAAPLVEALWGRLCEMAVVPDGHGHLRPAKALYLHPFDDIELVSQWHKSVKLKDACSKFVHPTCLGRQRMARLNELRSRLEDELPEPDLCAWFEAACDATASDVKRCLSLVARLPKTRNWWRIKNEIRRATIVLSQHGQLVAAQDAVIEGATEDIEGVFRVSLELLSDEEARSVLIDILQISNLDEGEWERRIRRLSRMRHAGTIIAKMKLGVPFGVSCAAHRRLF